MKDFFDSLRQQLTERMSSPIFGSFIISWIALNHHYLIILFSDLPVEHRFTLARSLFYPTLKDGLWHFVMLPALTSLAFVLIYPPLSMPLLAYWDWQQSLINRLRNRVQGNELLTRDISRKIIADSVALRKKYEEQVASLERELDAVKNPGGSVVTGDKTAEDLRQRNVALEDELRRLRAEMAPQNPFASYNSDTKKGIEELLKILAAAKTGRMLETELMTSLKTGVNRKQYLLDKAMQAQVVARGGDEHGRIWVSLNERGRDYVVNNNLAE